MDEGLTKRLFDFAVLVTKYSRTIPKTIEYKIIINQLVKAATSAGANYEEAQGANSKADFFNKLNISLKEMRESNYWLRIINEIKVGDEELEKLINESLQLKKILGAINSKSTKRNK